MSSSVTEMDHSLDPELNSITFIWLKMRQLLRKYENLTLRLVVLWKGCHQNDYCQKSNECAEWIPYSHVLQTNHSSYTASAIVHVYSAQIMRCAIYRKYVGYFTILLTISYIHDIKIIENWLHFNLCINVNKTWLHSVQTKDQSSWKMNTKL